MNNTSHTKEATMPIEAVLGISAWLLIGLVSTVFHITWNWSTYKKSPFLLALSAVVFTAGSVFGLALILYDRREQRKQETSQCLPG